MADFHLDPDGPHSDDNTRHVANAFAETVRVLNYATRTSDGVTYPSTVHDVLGSLRTGIQRMEQLLQQLGQRLGRFEDGDLADSSGGDPRQAAGDARLSIAEALSSVQAAAVQLDLAFNDTSGLYLRDGGEG
ncbi:hypothetical protein ACQP2T_13355 [Nonomuraea sp. CA-143628]|uniref:hypothetical protein n=1 Tax=Nonomuraea sp. CA-143628 TaxID=3239997 RepID=UPI003D8EB28A